MFTFTFRSMLAFLVIIASPCLRAADEQPAPEKPADPAAAAGAPHAVTHKPWSDELRAFCAEHKLDIKEQGDLQIKLLLIGGAQTPKAAQILNLAKQTLDGYELWTGQQEIFSRKHPLAEETYYLTVFHNDADYVAWIDDLRAKKLMPPPEGEDLAKKVSGFPRPRMMFSKQLNIDLVPENWAVYSASCLALDAFYFAHTGDKRGPAWIREGMAAEMQRLQCKGAIKCTTIAYEDNKEAAVDNWPREVSNMLARHDPKLISATEAMRQVLGSLAGAHYRQMWSLLAFVRQNCGMKKGPDNKFLRLLQATAEGTDSESAVKTILGASDPALTESWHAWIPTLK